MKATDTKIKVDSDIEAFNTWAKNLAEYPKLLTETKPSAKPPENILIIPLTTLGAEILYSTEYQNMTEIGLVKGTINRWFQSQSQIHSPGESVAGGRRLFQYTESTLPELKTKAELSSGPGHR